MNLRSLTPEQKCLLKRDGYVVLEDTIDPKIAARATELICKEPTRIVHGDNPTINDLYNKSGLRVLMQELMGEHSAPVNAQVAVTLPKFADAVVRRQASKTSHPQAHVDGGWSGLCPQKVSEILANGQTLATWGRDGDPKSMGPAGGAPLWQDKERRLALGSYTALVGVCLSDQIAPLMGQFAVRRGAHESVERFFRRQRDQGGPIGGGGPDWPRLQALDQDNAFAGIMPPSMVDSYPKTRFEMDDWPWPELTPVRMNKGDAVIALHSLPHTATPNMSDEPRMNVYFRIRRFRQQNPYEGDRVVGWGVSDHPDRALNGDFLEYPDSYDPFQTSIERMCDHWSEWDGMRDIDSAGCQLTELTLSA